MINAWPPKLKGHSFQIDGDATRGAGVGKMRVLLVKVQLTVAEQTDQTDDYQIQGHYVVQQLGGHENQDAGDQRREGTDGKVQVHFKFSLRSRVQGTPEGSRPDQMASAQVHGHRSDISQW
jgi:hypothetical protein